MKIGVDLDDVCNNLVSAWLEKYNEDYDDNVKIEDIKTWCIYEYVKCGKDIFKYLNDGKLYKSLSIKDNAANIIEKLCKDNDVYIVTANYNYGKEVCDDKINFIRKYLPFIDINNVIFTSHKYLLDLDVLIDDGLHNFEGFKGIKVVFDRPWNQLSNNCHNRMMKWDDEIIKFIDRYAK